MRGEGEALRDVLEARRARLFVGREAEVAAFDAMLAQETPARVLYLQGPGGIGKTQLLRELARRAPWRRLGVDWIDARTYVMDPTAIARDAASARGPDAGAEAEPRLLVIDHFEHLAAVEDWFRDSFLPALPAGTLVAFAGRTRLGREWRSDPGWRSALEVVELGPFSREETADYLARCELPAEVFEPLFAETRGHPLAVALVAEVARQRPGEPVRLSDEPDLIERLLSDFVRDVPSDLHGRALRAASIVLHATEENLALLLELDSAQVLYDWLSRLAFVDTTARGLVVHDLVRWVVLASLRWRAPELQRTLFCRALSYFHDRTGCDDFWSDRENFRDSQFVLAQAYGPLLERALFDPLALRPAGPEEWAAIEAMILRHEGERAVELARSWRDRPGQWVAVTDQEEDSRCRGFLHMIPLDEIDDEEAARDPGVGKLRRFLGERGVFDGGGRVGLVRSWMAEQEYQALSSIQTWLFGWIAEWLIAQEDLAYVLTCARDVDSWLAFMTPNSPQVLPAPRFDIDGRSYGYFGRDLRNTSLRAWYQGHFVDFLTIFSGGSVGAGGPPAPAAPELDREDLPRLVKQALQALHRPEVLCDSPLCALAAVKRGCGGEGDRPARRAAALAEVLREAAARAFDSPRDRHYHRVLELTYFEPATKQEAAAAELGVGYSTFRRHLAEAIRRLADNLWLDEKP
jgi:hypothetical protein